MCSERGGGEEQLKMYQAIRWRNNFMLKMGSEIQGPYI
jgi:hypothetical protein